MEKTEKPEFNISLVLETWTEAKKLLDLEIKLLKAEAEALALKTKEILVAGFLALIALLPAIVFLSLAASEAIHEIGGLPLWQSHLIVFVVYGAGSLILILKARKLVKNLTEKK